MLGFGAGVMVAASFWSLLNPAIELCSELGYSQIILPSIGFFAGGIFIILADKMMDKYSYGVITESDETGELMNIIAPDADTEFWLSAYETREEAEALCKEMGWKYD